MVTCERSNFSTAPSKIRPMPCDSSLILIYYCGLVYREGNSCLREKKKTTTTTKTPENLQMISLSRSSGFTIINLRESKEWREKWNEKWIGIQSHALDKVLACENIRSSSLFAAGDVSRGRTKRNGCFRRLAKSKWSWNQLLVVGPFKRRHGYGLFITPSFTSFWQLNSQQNNKFELKKKLT